MARKTVQLGVDDENLARKGLKIKFDQGQSYRLSLAGIPGLAEGQPDFSKPPEFEVTERFFCKPLKAFIRYAGPEHDRFLGAEQVRTYCVSPVVNWPATSRTLPQDIALQVMLSEFKVELWMVPGNAYRDLRSIAGTYPLSRRDLQITCSDAQYQKITMLPMENSMLEQVFAKRGNPVIDKAIAKLLEELAHVRQELGKELGRELSAADIDAQLTGSVGAPAGGGAAGTQRRATAIPSTADLDSLLQGMTAPSK